MFKKLPSLRLSAAAGLIVLLAATAFFFLNSKPKTVYSKAAAFGEFSLRNQEIEAGAKAIEQKVSSPIYIDLENKSRSVTMKEIGIAVNHENLLKATKVCRIGSLRLLCRKTNEQDIAPGDLISVDNAKLETFLTELDNELNFLANNTIISFEDYSFRAVSNNATVQVEKEKLMTPEGLAELIGSKDNKIKLNIAVLDGIEDQRSASEELIENITYPLLIKYGRSPIYIPEEKIAGFIGTEIRDNYEYGIILEQPVREYLAELKEDYGSDSVVVTENEAVNAIRRALLFRAANYEINNAVILPLEGSPKTNGELHDAYIEVIKSQQRAYRFENGELVKTYIVSTGLTWETPVGRYQVLGKQKMTISYFGNWYMPNYLPIGTIDGYRFGFHEIPYHLDGAGNIYSRDPNTMGSPATGGCIQLTREDSLELFEWAPIGLPVYIYE